MTARMYKWGIQSNENTSEGYAFLLLQKNVAKKSDNKYDKKIILQQKQEWMLRRLHLKMFKTADATGDLIENEIVNKITLAGKAKNKESKQSKERNEMQEIYIREKPWQTINDLRLIWAHIKMENQKIANPWDPAPDIMPRFSTKKWIEFHDQFGGKNNANNKIRFKTSMLKLTLWDLLMLPLLSKNLLLFQGQIIETEKIHWYSIYFFHIKDQWHSNRQRRRLLCHDANVQSNQT